MKLQGKRAIVTGGARGIGRAIAAGYLAVVKLARIRLWLPVDESTT